MRVLEESSLNQIAGGCAIELNCKLTTLSMLNYCQYPELQKINQILKNVAFSDEMRGATGEELKAAYIKAIEATTF